MPDLALSQATWQSKFRMKAVLFSMLRGIQAVLRHYRDRAARVREEFEQGKKLSAWSIVGAVLGTNTDHDGKLYVTATVAGANITIDVYDDAAKGALDRVATGTAAFPGTVTLAQDNASGMSGSVVVAAGMLTDSDIELRVIQDLGLRMENAYSGAVANDSTAKGRLLTFLDGTLKARALDLFTSAKSAVETEIRTWLKKWTEATDQVVSDGDIMTYKYDTSAGDGTVTIDKELGLLPWMFDAMGDDTVAGAQTVLKNTVTLGSLVKDADNEGDLNLSSTSSRENALSGKIRFECTDETIGSERFTVELILNEPLLDGTEILKAENVATIKKAWIDGKQGVGFTPVRATPVESNDNFNILSNYSVSGETAANTDDGFIYFRIEREPLDVWRVTAYQDAAHAVVLGDATATGTVGSQTITITGSGITITVTVDRAAAHANLPLVGDNDNDINIDILVSKLGDSYSFTVDNDYAGKFQSDFAYFFHAQAPSAAAGAETIEDGAAFPFDIVLEADEVQTPG